MDDYTAMANAQLGWKVGSDFGLPQPKQPRLASLNARLNQLNNQAIEIVGMAAGEIDRIIGTSPSNSLNNASPCTAIPVNCALGELDSLVDDLSSKLSSIDREVNRLRGL